MIRLKPRKIVRNILLRLLRGNGLVVLLGARQVGKTSIMQLLMDELLNVEKIEKNRVFYFDLEDMNLLEIVNRGIEEFIAFLRAKGANLKEKCFVFLDEIHYWRTKAGAEMDFILQGETLRAYEVKYRPFKQPEISRSIRSFIGKYSPDTVCICTRNFYHHTDIGKSDVFFSPVFFFPG